MRIQYHQTSFTTNVKGTYKSENTREEKDLQKQTQTIKKMAIGTCISIISSCKWIKCSKQKTQTD